MIKRPTKQFRTIPLKEWPSHFTTVAKWAGCEPWELSTQQWDAARMAGVNVPPRTRMTRRWGELRPPAPKVVVPPPDPVVTHRSQKEERNTKSELRAALDRCAALEDQLSSALDLKSYAPKVLDIRGRERTSGLREGTSVSLLSDTHVDEYVDPRKVSQPNSYNPTIAHERWGNYFDAIIGLREKESHTWLLRDHILWLGGDLGTLYVHPESVAMTPMETMRWLIDHCVWGINRLLQDKTLETLHIVCNDGNHSRLTQKPNHAKRTDHSLEWLLYHILRAHFENEPRVQFQIADGLINYKRVYDKTIRFLHGDPIRYKGGIGGIMIPANRMVAQWDKGTRADMTCIGHYHQYFDTPWFVVNGSLIGWNSFAEVIAASYERAQQAFFVMDSKMGKTASHPVWVTQS